MRPHQLERAFACDSTDQRREVRRRDARQARQIGDRECGEAAATEQPFGERLPRRRIDDRGEQRRLRDAHDIRCDRALIRWRDHDDLLGIALEYEHPHEPALPARVDLRRHEAVLRHGGDAVQGVPADPAIGHTQPERVRIELDFRARRPERHGIAIQGSSTHPPILATAAGCARSIGERGRERGLSHFVATGLPPALAANFALAAADLARVFFGGGGSGFDLTVCSRRIARSRSVRSRVG